VLANTSVPAAADPADALVVDTVVGTLIGISAAAFVIKVVLIFLRHDRINHASRAGYMSV
jgi:hypothetical protein